MRGTACIKEGLGGCVRGVPAYTQVGEKEVILVEFGSLHDAIAKLEGYTLAREPMVHPLVVSNFLKGPEGGAHLEKLSEAGVQIFRGVVPAKALLYNPTGWIKCERNLSVCFGFACSVVPYCDAGCTQFETILASINKFQGSAKTKATDMYKGMTATSTALQLFKATGGAETCPLLPL